MTARGDFDGQAILRKMMENHKYARQLVWARAKSFGCGRSINRYSRVDPPIEHVVCVIDEVKNLSNP